MRVAQIIANKVVNVIKVNDFEWAESHIDGTVVDVTSMSVKIGDHYEEGQFISVDSQTQYRTTFSPEELLGAFTTDEAFLAASSEVPEVQLQIKVLSFKRPVEIQASDDGYQNAINKLEAAKILTPDRAASLRLGIPL